MTSREHATENELVSQVSAELRHGELLSSFVSAWQILDGFRVIENIDPNVSHFAVGEEHRVTQFWRPLRQATETSALEPLYAKLPARFPTLYERLVLTYRWPAVDLGLYRLVGNPQGSGLAGLFGEMTRDKFLSDFLLRMGFIPFGKGPDMDYDPVCFDLRSRKKNREMAIVKIDHEEILCNKRLKIVSELAPSFDRLVEKTIELAHSKSSASSQK